MFITLNYFNTRWFFSHKIFSFFVYWIIYTSSWHCFHLIPKPDTAIAMRNQNQQKIIELILFFVAYLRRTCSFLFCEISILLLVSKTHWEKDGFSSANKRNLEGKQRYIFEKNIVSNHWKSRFKRSKMQNFLRLPTMVADRIFRHIPTDCPGFEMTAEKWNYLITMTAGIQNVISSADVYGIRCWKQEGLGSSRIFAVCLRI